MLHSTETARPLTTVGDVMSTDLIVVAPGDPIGRARNMLLGVGVHALPVLDGSLVVGIVTSTDLLEPWADSRPVREVMTPAPARISASASLADAAIAMVDREIHHLIVDGGPELGIVSALDLIRALTESSRSD